MIGEARWAALIPRANPAAAEGKRRPTAGAACSELVARAAANPRGENAPWLLDNFRLIFTAEKETREFAFAQRDARVVTDSSGAETPRACLLAREYLAAAGQRFCESELVAFLEGFQETAPLDSVEIWNLKPALQLELIDRLTRGNPSEYPALLTSLRRIGETVWKDFFELVSSVHRLLARDPAGAYSRMDFESRDRYRRVVAELARHGRFRETEVATAAIHLCEQARQVSDDSRAAVRRTHVGFYLIDQGRCRLEEAIGYHPPLRKRIPRFILQWPTSYYLLGIELITLSIVFDVLYRVGLHASAYTALLFMALPATQAAVDFMNNLTTFLLPPRVLPKLDFSEGIPDDCVTLVAVPTLFANEAQVHDLVLDLEIRFLANSTRNLYFALLTDTVDSDHPEDQNDQLVELGARLIEGLNSRYRVNGRPPFFLLHRHRTYNQSEGRWMGWERKRGKLLDLNQLLQGGFDAFPVKVGDTSLLADVRYVITLDSDTQLPRDSAAGSSAPSPIRSTRPWSIRSRESWWRVTASFSPRSASACNPPPAAAWPLCTRDKPDSIFTRAPSPTLTRTCSAKAFLPARASTK